jgi:hypothetical protein
MCFGSLADSQLWSRLGYLRVCTSITHTLRVIKGWKGADDEVSFLTEVFLITFGLFSLSLWILHLNNPIIKFSIELEVILQYH